MCGRFTLTTTPRELAEHFGLDPAELEGMPALAPRYNVAPGQPVVTVHAESDAASGVHRRPAVRRWGLVPPWAEGPSVAARMINARAETLAERPAYRDAFRRSRCLVPADGFYEWASGPPPRQPHHVHLPGGGVFAMAGLWERWRGPGGSPLESCTIVTTKANERLRPLHDRMPVILDAAAYDLWLDPASDPARLSPLLAPWPSEHTALRVVDTRVNDATFDGPECLAAPPPGPVQESLF